MAGGAELWKNSVGSAYSARTTTRPLVQVVVAVVVVREFDMMILFSLERR